MIFSGNALPGVPGSSGLPVPGPTGNTSCGTQPANNQYLCGLNTTVTDPDFHAQIVRATDYSMASEGTTFNLGSGGDLHRWASDSSKLIVNNSGGAYTMLAFNPALWGSSPVTVTDLTGINGFQGGVPAFSNTNPHVLYTLNEDQEQTLLGAVTSGSCVTPETIKQSSTNATAKLQAVNGGVLIQIGPVTGTADGTHTWTGQTSGCVFTPASPFLVPATGSATPNANVIYAGLINDATQPDPTQWTITYSLVFNFSYVASMVGTAAASYFPSSSTSCLPANYPATWNNVFMSDASDTSFQASFGDNGQSNGWSPTAGSCPNSPGGMCTGPVWVGVYKAWQGCRMWNSHTDQVTGDWGPAGQLQDAEHSYITGTMSGTPAVGAYLTQATTGAVAEFFCPGNLLTSQTAPSGYTYNQFVCTATSPTAWKVGRVYGMPDATHSWGDGSGNSLTPSALPTLAPFYFPNAEHDGQQAGIYAEFGNVQGPRPKVASIQGNTPSVGYTTITFTGSATTFLTDKQAAFYNLTGADDQYLKCSGLNTWCPLWTISSGTAVSGGTSIVITDAVNPNGSYSDTEGTGTVTIAGNGWSTGYLFPVGGLFWDPTGLTVNTCLSGSCQGHSAKGNTGEGDASYYTWHNYANPSLPCAVNMSGSFASPPTPCPLADEFPLLQSAVPGDQHGMHLNHGPADLTPLGLSVVNVCGQASNGPLGASCPTYTQAWMSELIAVENSVTNNVNSTCGASTGPGCHCNYGSGPAACTYRFNHSFNSNDSWDFNAQNAIGNISPDGQWFAFPSTWMNALGCMNGATACWGSYVASGLPTASLSGATIQTDAGGVVTVTMPNQFCAPGGNQYWWTGSAVDTIACGPLAEQVTLSGFAESWANQTLTLTAVGGCDSTDSNAGNCTSFSGTGTGVPANYGPVTESSGTQKAAPVSCVGGGGAGTYCQRSDIWIAKLGSAH